MSLPNPKSSNRPYSRKKLLHGGQFALGLMVGFTTTLFLFLLLDFSSIGFLADRTLFGAVLGGLLAGSTALASTVLSNYYLLRQNFEDSEVIARDTALSILTKLHEARDALVKSYRHHFDGSHDNVIRYGKSGIIHKPLSFSLIEVKFSDVEKAFLLGRGNSHLFNLILDADRLISSFNNLTLSYEKQFYSFQSHVFSKNEMKVRGSHISGEVDIDPFELLKMEDIRNVFKSFLRRSQAPMVGIFDATIDFIRTEFGRKIDYAQDPEMSGSAENEFQGFHGG